LKPKPRSRKAYTPEAGEAKTPDYFAATPTRRQPSPREARKPGASHPALGGAADLGSFCNARGAGVGHHQIIRGIHHQGLPPETVKAETRKPARPIPSNPIIYTRCFHATPPGFHEGPQKPSKQKPRSQKEKTPKPARHKPPKTLQYLGFAIANERYRLFEII